MKNSKRILSVVIKRMLDESPDTSWLGEYSNHATSEFSIDRAHARDCAINTGKPADVPAHTLYECGSCNCLHSWTFDGDCRDDANRFGDALEYAIKQGMANDSDLLVLTMDDRTSADSGEYCDCGESGDMKRGQLRYFNPSLNYVDKNGKATDTPENVRKYTRQDYERMERLNAGDWCFIGICAEAEIGIGDMAIWRYGELSQEIYLHVPNDY